MGEMGSLNFQVTSSNNLENLDNLERFWEPRELLRTSGNP